jgi:hypothetical protein
MYIYAGILMFSSISKNSEGCTRFTQALPVFHDIPLFGDCLCDTNAFTDIDYATR